MSEANMGRRASETEMVSRIIRAVVLIVVALILAVVSVSFAVHHMRLKFEEEYRAVTDSKMQSVSDIVQRACSGDEILADPQKAIEKYKTVFDLMLANTSKESYSKEDYALFLYSGGALSLLTTSDDEVEFTVVNKPISEWLSADNAIYPSIEGQNAESVLVPITDSEGKCVAVFEYRCTFDALKELGNEAENRILKAVIISCAAGVVLFLFQLFLPKLIMRSGKKGGSSL